MNWQEYLHVAGSALTVIAALGIYLLKKLDVEAEKRRQAELKLAIKEAVNEATKEITLQAEQVRKDLVEQLKGYVPRPDFDRVEADRQRMHAENRAEFASIRTKLESQSQAIAAMARRARKT